MYNRKQYGYSIDIHIKSNLNDFCNINITTPSNNTNFKICIDIVSASVYNIDNIYNIASAFVYNTDNIYDIMSIKKYIQKGEACQKVHLTSQQLGKMKL